MTRWSTLPAYLVRLAGFAYGRLDALRCSRAAAAEGVLAEAAAARLAAGRALDEALGQERYADHPALDDPAVRKALSREVKRARAFARQLSDGPVPSEALREVVRSVPRVAGHAAELERSHAAWRDAAHAFAAMFAEDFERARRAIRELYRDERLQEAVFLESPEAFERIQQLLASSGPRNARARQRERLAAMYAQRFCAKNDTNSMCGPHGVGYLTPGEASGPGTSPDAALAVELGLGRAPAIEIVREDARRETYFSHWAAQRLLDEAVRRAGDASPVTLRLHPMARIDGSAVAWCAVDYDGTTFRRRHARSELPEAGVRLVRALAHPRTRAQLAELAREIELPAAELTAFIEQLVGAGIVLRGPMLPPGLFRPLRAVAAELASWPPSDARSWALAEVSAIEELVAGFARAPLAGRLELYRRLVARFEQAAGVAASRGDGAHYADRSVLHEDCYVEVRSQLGAARATLEGALPALVSVLELPIELGREQVREWFRARFGAGVRVPALEVHRAFDAERVLEAPASTPRAEALRLAIERVRETIARAAGASGGGPVRLRADELRAALAGVAAPTHPGYLSFDVMPRRRSDGGAELVLSEVHGGFWLSTCLLDILPPDHRERVLGEMRAAVHDMARGRRTAECVFLHTQATDRRLPLATIDLQMLAPSERPDALDLGALDLRLAGDDLEFLHGDEEIIPLVAFNRYQFLYLTSRFAPVFDHHSDRFFPDSLLPDALRAGDVPRLSVDEVVFQRRLWRRSAAAVRAALAAGSEAELFRRAQALRRELGCDTRVFASVAGEPKPVLLDFHDVFLLEALANLLERRPDDAVVKISEMLPGPDELVARGPDGLRTAELRMGYYRA
ncbi:MAG TPA: lantibiotic dehydratase [Kofleriaceae bacterium]|nr:lantibiotic dehydratase [Kofleriaceae bacterium]